MPYEQELSDYKASGNNVKDIISSNLFNSLTFKDKLREQILIGLKHLQDKKRTHYIKTKKDNIYESLYCIDGSYANLNNSKNEIISLRVGSAILNTNQLFNIEKDKFGTPNPYQVAELYQHPGNLYLNNAFPSKNTYLYQNGKFLTMIESFEMSLLNLFDSGLAKEIKDLFFLESNIDLGLTSKNIITDLPVIQEILKNIREESVVFSTQTEVQKLMLITETILSQYLLGESSKEKEKGLIVLDGRLQNEDLGQVLKNLNEAKIQNIDTMMIGVQKTGRLNLLLSKIHDILKNEDLGSDLKDLKYKYLNGESILFILDKKFKEYCGIPDSGYGIYGVDCLYITEEPSRKEFVFTLPTHIFEQNKFQGNQTQMFKSLTSVFEYANTDLYFKEKGALLTNILAHSNVSLNIKYTSVLGNEINDINTKNLNTNKKKI